MASVAASRAATALVRLARAPARARSAAAATASARWSADAPSHHHPRSVHFRAHRPSHTRAFATAGLPHDIGGATPAYGPLTSQIERPDDLLDWEVRCHALFAVLATKGAVSTDGLRRSIESLTPQQYETWTYYEKWAAGMTNLLLENGIIASDELRDALFGTDLPPTPNGEPVFDVGDSVRVRSYRDGGASGIEWRRPHIRVPGYVYGVRGIIERLCGEHQDPSFLAFGMEAPTVRLYRVRFRMRDVWPEHRDGTSEDVVEVEVYEPWLEPSVESSGHDFEANELFDHSYDGSDCIDKDEGGSPHSHEHHDHEHHDHSHSPRLIVEERAATLEGAPRPGKELYSALMKVLLEKGIIAAEEVTSMAEKLVMAGTTLNGAALVAKAWMDPAFEERLLQDASAASAEIDIVTSNPNAPTVLTVVKNTPTVHNLVVCTLCSCYPSGLLGIAPSWYKSREYRSRAVREPRQVLLEFGTRIPESARIRVHDSTADHRYLVLPTRPAGTEGWSEEELRALVTRDSMVGVSLLPDSP